MGKHHVVATIYDRQGRVLSCASNSYTKTHPIQSTFARKTGAPDKIYLHAEIAALVKLRKGQQPHKIKIERYTKDDRPALARPCPTCEAALKHWGVVLVEYTL